MSARTEALMPLDDETFIGLRGVLNRNAGLVFAPDAKYLFQKRLSERVTQHGLADFSDYLELLEKNEDELSEAFERLTTKETYFFRQEYQLRSFIDEVLPELIAASKSHKRLTFWSAGCSTGEEAYTLAMLLGEVPALHDFRYTIIGSDLCRSNIAHATRAIYRENAFRATSDELKQKYFDRTPQGLRPKEQYIKHCHFCQTNLLSPSQVKQIGRVDIIFCRNVLIYFDQAARQQVVEQFFQRLVPRGYLFLGHSENLLNMQSPFTPRNLKEDIAYQRLGSDRPGGLL